MREIKFRAWDKRGKEMEMIDDLYWFEERGVHSADESSSTMGEFILMQFTGLKDKNGVEIYEDEVISNEAFNPKEMIVKFIEGQFVLVPIGVDSYPVDIHYAISGRVIGNIYENPELLL